MASSTTDRPDISSNGQPSYTAYLLSGTLERRDDVDLRRVGYDADTDAVVVEHTAPNHGEDVDDILAAVYVVAGVYIGIVDDGDCDAETLHGRLFDPDGEDAIAWRVESDWVDQFLAGNATERDVLERLSETFTQE